MSNSDDLEAIRSLRPDNALPDEPGDPAQFSSRKHRLMAGIDDHEHPEILSTPDVYPRLAYNDEYAAIDYLSRVFGFAEIREARQTHGEHCLAWFRIGTGVVMVGHMNGEVHQIYSPTQTGLTTVMINVYVANVDDHYASAVAEGAYITTPLADTFYGERRYEATDPEGHRWNITERFDSIRKRSSHQPDGDTHQPVSDAQQR